MSLVDCTNLQFANEQTVSAQTPNDCISWKSKLKSSWHLLLVFFSTSVLTMCSNFAWNRRKPHLMSKSSLLSSHLPNRTQLSHTRTYTHTHTHTHTHTSEPNHKQSSLYFEMCMMFWHGTQTINSWSWCEAWHISKYELDHIFHSSWNKTRASSSVNNTLLFKLKTLI